MKRWLLNELEYGKIGFIIAMLVVALLAPFIWIFMGGFQVYRGTKLIWRKACSKN